MRTRFTGRPEGFTLVEVMIALAVISFGIVAILGLLPTGLQSSRDAADNTLSATIIQDLFSQLRGGSFTNAPLCNLCATPTINLQNSGTATVTYDYKGYETNSAGAYYRIFVTFTNQAPLALSQVTAAVVWPAQSKAPINTNIFVTKVAQYNQ